MKKCNKKEEEDGSNKKEENMLEMALSPAVAGHIFEGGAVSK